MWISFKEEDVKWKHQSREVPFAIRMYAGEKNIISGEPRAPNLSALLETRKLPENQDYFVVPKQHWIDGIAVSPNILRQFVTIPYVSDSIENKVSGMARESNIKIEIIPASAGMRIAVITFRKFYVYMCPDDTVDSLRQIVANRDGVAVDEYELYFASRKLEESEWPLPSEAVGMERKC